MIESRSQLSALSLCSWFISPQFSFFLSHFSDSWFSFLVLMYKRVVKSDYSEALCSILSLEQALMCEWKHWSFQVLTSEVWQIGLECVMGSGCSHPIISLICDAYKLIIKLSPILLNVLLRNHVSFSTARGLRWSIAYWVNYTGVPTPNTGFYIF